MQQMTTDALPEGYLPCSNPGLVEGYASIEEILQGRSGDFGRCHTCDKYLCKHHLDYKRQDASYKVLVQHFRNGGMINQPISYHPEHKSQGNGHHRLVAAYDAGFTHIPYSSDWGESDWEGVDLSRYGFRLVTDSWGDQYVHEMTTE